MEQMRTTLSKISKARQTLQRFWGGMGEEGNGHIPSQTGG